MRVERHNVCIWILLSEEGRVVSERVIPPVDHSGVGERVGGVNEAGAAVQGREVEEEEIGVAMCVYGGDQGEEAILERIVKGWEVDDVFGTDADVVDT